MAQAADVPLIPMAIWGSQRVWTKDHPKRLGRTNIPITLSVGEPLRVTRKDNADQANLELRGRISALLHAAQDSYPRLSGDELRFVPTRLGGTAPTPEQALAMDEADAVRRAAR
jgi:1-acyl-sn-glycerol-3-phosphate acyltransferase